MALERVRRRGPFAPLSATYYHDDAIAEAGEAAELLFLRGIAYCAQNPSHDGFISEMQLVRHVGVGMSNAVERAEALVEVDLWLRVPRGYKVRSWLSWNRSGEEIEEYKQRDRTRKTGSARKGPQAPAEGSAESASPSERNPSGIRAEGVAESERTPTGAPSGVGSESDTQSKTDTDTEQDREELSPSGEQMEALVDLPGAAASTSRSFKPGSDDDPDWLKFWKVYPRKDGKDNARIRWAQAIKKAPPALIIERAQRYAEQQRREGTPKNKIKMAEGWLNNKRWEDESLSKPANTSPFGGGYSHETTASEVWG